MVQINITLEHDDGVVRARSWIKGHVTISTDVNILLVELHLDLVGLERTITSLPHYSKEKLRIVTPTPWFHVPFHTCEHTILAERRILIDSPKHSAPGSDSMTYPFSFFLPSGLPSTMNYSDTESKGSCAIHYKLTASASLHIVHENDSLTTVESTCRMHTVQRHVDLTVIGETISAIKYPYVVTPSCFPLKQNLLHHGHLTLALRSENTHVCKGGNVHFTLAVSNKSHYNVDRVEVAVIEKVQWRSASREPETSQITSSTESSRAERSHVLRSYTNWLPDGLQVATDYKSGSFCFKDPAISSNELYKIDELMHDDRNQICVRVPVKSLVSCHGQLIQIQHSIQVTLIMKGISSHSYPVLTFPITVYDSPLHSVCSSHVALLGTVDIAMKES